jgi:hypothetical protein
MAANMQQMAGAGQMMPQQLRRPTANSHQIQQMVYQNLLQNSQPPNGLTWQGTVSLNDRMGKTMDLYVFPFPRCALLRELCCRLLI